MRNYRIKTVWDNLTETTCDIQADNMVDAWNCYRDENPNTEHVKAIYIQKCEY